VIQGRWSVHCLVHVDDTEHLAAEWRKAGIEIIGHEDYDYGKRERSSDPTEISSDSGHPCDQSSHAKLFRLRSPQTSDF
jgi:hypothetical protein